MNGGIILNDNDFRNESQRYFDEMMKRKPAKEDNLDINAVFTDEEIIFMGNYDLPKFGAKFPNEAEEFMDELDDGRL